MTDARPGAVPPKVLRPRDAATLIIVDMAGGEPRVLLGRRRADLAFMPGRYVFPGGRVDPSDRHIPVEHDLEPGNIRNLMVAMKGNRSPGRARALALAAVRETFEEAGLLIGTPAPAAPPPKASAWQAVLLSRLSSGAGAADLLRAGDHAARASAALRYALLLHCGGGHRPQGRRRRRRTLRPRMALDRAGACPGTAQHHAGRAGGSERAHRRRSAAEMRCPRTFLPPPQRNFPPRPHWCGYTP